MGSTKWGLFNSCLHILHIHILKLLKLDIILNGILWYYITDNIISLSWGLNQLILESNNKLENRTNIYMNICSDGVTSYYIATFRWDISFSRHQVWSLMTIIKSEYYAKMRQCNDEPFAAHDDDTDGKLTICIQCIKYACHI